ncbi:MAG: penicillin-binding protein 2 [Deferribacteraceae bacterium]|jgi:penicillin-binding protein 2|nr:penicillin-binding protein 2 [Deferribacteraceae bacterium]
MPFQPLKENVMHYFALRVRFAVFIVVVLCAAVSFRLMNLQVFRYNELAALSENNSVRIMRIRADRGFIKDRSGRNLVLNAPGYEVEIVKEDIKNVNELLDNLSKFVLLDKNKVQSRIKRSYFYEPVKVTRGLTFEDISYFMEHSENYPGVQFIADPMRSYDNSTIFSHILGYVAEVNEQEVAEGYQPGDIVGRSGLERQFERELSGISGSRRVIVDSLGRVMETLSEIPPVPGRNIILTIDYALQSYIDTIMDGRVGSVVVLDNADNSIIAIYSSPTYDLNKFNPFITDENWQKLAGDAQKPLLNRSIEGMYPPGSVFKIMVAVAGLMEGVITPETTFYCSGSFKATARTNIIHNCWRRYGHGEMKLKRAIAESCDVYFYNVGYLLGIDKLSEYAKKFMLGNLTQIDLPNEKTGVFPSREWKLQVLNEQWYPGETVNISIGQGYTTTTPLQIAVMVASIFNGGYVYAPRIVSAVEDPITGERAEIAPTLLNQVNIPKEVRDTVMEALVDAVEDKRGTSWRARVAEVRLGGKTGTAQVISLKRTENMKEEDIPLNWRDHSWFTGIYPSDNPRYAVVVLVEHGGSGGKSSAPLAGAIINKMVSMGYK